MKMKKMCEAEKKYASKQSAQISAQTGLIGSMRAELDDNGNLFSSWGDCQRHLKTKEFIADYDTVLAALRKKNGFLFSRIALAEFCAGDIAVSLGYGDYGVRIDTDAYSFIFRLNTSGEDCDVCAFCYKKQWLDDNIREAEKGVRFITPHYQTLFSVADGDSVRIKTPGLSDSDKICRYIDDYHVEIGTNLYHICEFAERMENSGSTVIPLRRNLPEYAFAYLETAGIVRIKKGEHGYEKTNCGERMNPEEYRKKATDMNNRCGVSKAQAKAMLAGSMYGWDCAAANPDNYVVWVRLPFKDELKQALPFFEPDYCFISDNPMFGDCSSVTVSNGRSEREILVREEAEAYPVLCFKNGKLPLGTMFTFFDKKFFALSEQTALCLESPGKTFFNETSADGNNFETSFLKGYLEEWLGV